MRRIRSAVWALLLCPLGFSPPSYAAEPEKFGTKQMLVAGMLESSKYRILSSIVGQLILELPDGSGGSVTSPVCTAIAISATHVLTAKHCLQSPTGAAANYLSVSVRLGGLEATDGFVYFLEHDAVQVGPVDADFAVLQVSSGQPLLAARGLDFLESGSDPKVKANLSILHAPGTGPIFLTNFECNAASAPVGMTFVHSCQTQEGSSGAPIFDEDYKWVAIHTGLSAQPNSSVKGSLLLSAVRSRSSIVENDFGKKKNAAIIVATAITSEFLLLGDQHIFESQGNWNYKTGTANETSTPLVLQVDDPVTLSFGIQREILLLDFPKSAACSK